MKIKSLLFFFFPLVLFSFLPSVFAKEISQPKQLSKPSQLVSLNPFTLTKNRIVPGTAFKIDVDKTFNKEKDKVSLTLIYISQKDTKPNEVRITNFFVKPESDKLMIRAVFPEFEKMPEIRTQSPWRGAFSPFKGDLEIIYERENGDIQTFLFPVMIPSVK